MHPGVFQYSLTPAGEDLAKEAWESVVAIYQRSSGETHVFNQVTMLILDCLQGAQAPIDTILRRTEESLGIQSGTLIAENFVASINRLDELGLIEKHDLPSEYQ